MKKPAARRPQTGLQRGFDSLTNDADTDKVNRVIQRLTGKEAAPSSDPPVASPKVSTLKTVEEIPEETPEAPTPQPLEAEVAPALAPSISPEPRTRLSKKTGLHLLLQRAQLVGVTHPKHGSFLRLPIEFDAILALESKAVSQVILEILRQTLGWADADAPSGHREWVRLGHTHFHNLGMSKSQTNHGLKTALQRGYIKRRRVFDGYEYAVRFADGRPLYQE